MTYTDLMNLIDSDAMPDPKVVNEDGEAIADIMSNGVTILTAEEYNALAEGGPLYPVAEQKALKFLGKKMYYLCLGHGMMPEAILVEAGLF